MPQPDGKLLRLRHINFVWNGRAKFRLDIQIYHLLTADDQPTDVPLVCFVQPQQEATPAVTEVQLCVMLSPEMRNEIRAVAKARGLTSRTLVLSALRDAGVLTRFPDVDLTDRRASIAATKARLWREHVARMPEADKPA